MSFVHIVKHCNLIEIGSRIRHHGNFIDHIISAVTYCRPSGAIYRFICFRKRWRLSPETWQSAHAIASNSSGPGRLFRIVIGVMAHSE